MSISKSEDEGKAAPYSRQQIVRIEAVEALTQLSRATIYHLIRAGKFPKSIQLSEKARGWRLREIEEYLASRTAPDANSWRPPILRKAAAGVQK